MHSKLWNWISPIYFNIISFPDFEEEFSLVFDHTTEEPTATATINDQVEKVMLRLVNPSSNVLSAKQDSAHEFTTLVRLLRKMDEKRMKIVWDKYFDCLENGVCSDANVRDLYRYVWESIFERLFWNFSVYFLFAGIFQDSQRRTNLLPLITLVLSCRQPLHRRPLLALFL